MEICFFHYLVALNWADSNFRMYCLADENDEQIQDSNSGWCYDQRYMATPSSAASNKGMVQFSDLSQKTYDHSGSSSRFNYNVYISLQFF